MAFTDPRSVRYTGKHSLHMFFGLSIPHVNCLPARSLRRSLCHPRWMRGTGARLSRARTTMNRSNSPVPFCSAPILRFAYPVSGRGDQGGLPRFARISCRMSRSRTPTADQSCNSGVPLTPAGVPAREAGFCRPERYGLPVRSPRRPPHLNAITKLNRFRGLRFPLRPTAFSVYA